MGYVLYDSSTTPLRWGSHRLDTSTLPLETRQTQIAALELIAPLWALQNLTDLRSSQLDVYIDNSTAEHILSKGSSRSIDLNKFAEQFWTLAVARNLSVRIFRVASKLNVADAASRFLIASTPPVDCTRPRDSCRGLVL